MRILGKYLHDESVYALVLMLAVILAFVFSNTALKYVYHQVLETEFAVIFNNLKFSKTFALLINDGLMTIFFLSVSLELKREITMGHLSHPMHVLLPALCAIGGVLEPAAIYYNFNRDIIGANIGWAIPTATDIVFSLSIINVFGARVPHAARLFLLTVAIFDDVIAISIIALFYSHNIYVPAIWLSIAGVGILYILNRTKVNTIAPYALVGFFIWVCMLHSGIHSTLTGVILGMFIPIHHDHHHSLLHKLEHSLRHWVNLLIIPIFALCNSGLEIGPLLHGDIFNDITLGVSVGLFIGKQMGIFCMAIIGIRLLKLPMPRDTSWATLYGVSVIGGVGFTMSIFISNLSFVTTYNNPEYLVNARLGILLGSVFSAILGATILHFVAKKRMNELTDKSHEINL